MATVTGGFSDLIDDGPIVQATTRRNMESVNQVFGNKLAILGGDFLLSRASISLARLRNLEVRQPAVGRCFFLLCAQRSQAYPLPVGRP